MVMGIIFGVFMAANTMSAGQFSLYGSGDACPAYERTATEIQAARDGLQMIGVHASTITTQMVELQSFRDWASEQFVYNSVSTFRLVFNTNLPVAFSVRSTSPEPAAAFNLPDFRENSFFYALWPSASPSNHGLKLTSADAFVNSTEAGYLYR